MKRIHLMPTDKPSRLVMDTIENKLYHQPILHNKTVNVLNQDVCITSDGEIEQGDWCIYQNQNFGFKIRVKVIKHLSKIDVEDFKKIILTTNSELIEDGVQAIDDEFLEWFVENPSCEMVEVKPLLSNNGRALFGYKIIIPK